VQRRVGKPGLIHYSWGEQDTLDRSIREPWYRRLGFRDAKRVAVTLVLLFYFCGLSVALSMRRPVLVRFAPDRTTLYSILDDGRVVNRIRMTLANRSSEPTTVRISVEKLPNAELALDANPVPLEAGQVLEKTFELRAPRWEGSSDVNRFRLVAHPAMEKSPETFDLTFIMPVKGASQP
jgi:hypothetical protein